MPNQKHIIVADDDEFLTSMYRLSLQSGDTDVLVTYDGKQALEEIAKNPPDLLVLDLLMPVLDGFEVLKQLNAQGSKIPVIILSNLQDHMDKDKCLELGAKDYFCKNALDLSTLAAKVRTYL